MFYFDDSENIYTYMFIYICVIYRTPNYKILNTSLRVMLFSTSKIIGTNFLPFYRHSLTWTDQVEERGILLAEIVFDVQSKVA